MNSSATSDRISDTWPARLARGCRAHAPPPVRRGRPSKITGTFELLVERFGAEVATEIITKNPGILSCVASSVAKQSNDEILKATAFADGLVENREAVKLAIFGAVFAFFNLIGWRILTTSTNPKVEKIAAFFNL